MRKAIAAGGAHELERFFVAGFVHIDQRHPPTVSRKA
jgi:hypothetical protein